MKLIKDRVKKLLKDYNILHFCKDNGIKRNTLSRIICPSRECKDMELTTAYKLAKGLNMSLDELVEKVYSFEEELESVLILK